ncbi:MAG: PqqD family protein [Terracidiphilus sp.]
MSPVIMHTVSENVTWKNLGNSVVLLNLTDSNYYVLNETASLAFRGVLERQSTEQIAKNFSQEYDCSPDQAKADVEEIMQYLTGEKLLKAVEE